MATPALAWRGDARAAAQGNNRKQARRQRRLLATVREQVAEQMRRQHRRAFRCAGGVCAPDERDSARAVAAVVLQVVWRSSYLAVLAGVLIGGLLVEACDGGGLGARQVWLYGVILPVGYMISRGGWPSPAAGSRYT
jgi:hypothetical protein